MCWGQLGEATFPFGLAKWSRWPWLLYFLYLGLKTPSYWNGVPSALQGAALYFIAHHSFNTKEVNHDMATGSDIYSHNLAISYDIIILRFTILILHAYTTTRSGKAKNKENCC